jgi:hypothetical protein
MQTYKRAGFACNCLLGVEMSLSTAAFWAHAFSDPKLSGLLVALLLTAAFGSVSLLASGLVGRLILARQARQWFTFASAGFCGLVLVMIAAFMVHHGLVWADRTAGLLAGDGEHWALVPAAVLLSGFNVVGGYAFGRELRLLKPVVADNPAAQLANMRWQRP